MDILLKRVKQQKDVMSQWLNNHGSVVKGGKDEVCANWLMEQISKSSSVPSSRLNLIKPESLITVLFSSTTLSHFELHLSCLRL